MNEKTTTTKHTPYFDVVNDPESIDLSGYEKTLINVAIHNTNLLFQCDEVCYLVPEKGIISLVVSEFLEISHINRFMLHGFVAIKPNIYFNCLAVSPECSFYMYTSKKNKVLAQYLNQQISSKQFSEQFFIPNIYAFYRQEKVGPYYYGYEDHHYCEITIVDSGRFITEVDGQSYELTANQVIVYGPNQNHNQKIVSGDACRYVTVMFEMSPVYPELLNRVFTLSHIQIKLIESILRTSDYHADFSDELVISKFKEFMIRLLIDHKEDQQPSRMTSMRFNYESNLINEMINYIHNNIYQSLQVTDLCEQFAVSRTVVQDLFNKNLSITPKAYINQVKLQQSKMLINESKYTISEIASILNYSSVHYFSRVFKSEFHISPTEYAKSILK